MINKQQVMRRFGRMSASYDEYARIQKDMAASLLALIKNNSKLIRILEIGCGTGYFTRLLSNQYPHAEILATDISPGMLTTARSKLAGCSNIRYALEDGENLQIREKFDLVISNAAFQWFNNHPQAYTGFYNCLNPGGYLIYTTFGPKTFYELHASFKAAREILDQQSEAQHGQSFADAAFLAQSMESAGFCDISHTEAELREYFPSVKDFMQSVKKIGANNASYDANRPVSRKLMFTMMEYYETHFKEENSIHATYHAIYGMGRKQ